MQIRFIIFLLLLAACNVSTVKQPKMVPSRSIRVKLVDSLGEVRLSIPERYDTIFSWVNYSDCGKACAHQEYRYQPKALRITKESGFFWFGEPRDSVDRFTIIHSSEVFLDPDFTSIDSLWYKYWKHWIADHPEYPEIIYDTIEKIGDRYFSIFVMKRSDTIQNFRVWAGTNIKGNQVQFRYDLLSKKNDSVSRDFIKNSLELIHTIRINKGIEGVN